MKCSRPKCTRTARVNHKGGLCNKHYEALPNRGYVDAAPVQEHLEHLYATGKTLKSVSEVTGLSADTLCSVSRRTWVQKRTAVAVMAIETPGGFVSSRRVVSAVGTRRRLQALMASGWSRVDLAEKFGVSERAVRNWMDRSGVEAGTAASVARMFTDLEMTSGTSTRSAIFAKRHGWPPPLAWDPDQIDDPNAMPDARINVYASTRRLRSLCRMGFSQKYLAERLDIGIDVVSEILRFYGPIDYSLADSIEKLFGELRVVSSDDDRLTSRRAAQSRTVTARYGWPLPDDLGDVFKTPSKGEFASMDRSNDQRIVTVKKMLSEGVSKAEIARRMNVNPTTVYFWLKEVA